MLYDTSENQSVRVTVVVPHKGPARLLQSCISALRAQTYPKELTSVIVVMNEPEQSALPFEPLDNELILWQPEYFSYAARNHGIRHSNGDVIALTDSDTIPDPNWLAAGIASIETGADLVAGHIDLSFTTNPLSPSACYEKLYAFDQEKNVGGGFSTTANLFAQRHVFTQQGLFDETAVTGEDFEWTKSAVEDGATLTYSPDAIVEHPARETWSALFAKARRTTLPYVNISEPGSTEGNHLRERLRFQLGATPSHPKVSALSKTQRSVARLVRLVIVGYKALCLMQIPPAFQRDLQAIRARQVAVAPAIQGANT